MYTESEFKTIFKTYQSKVKKRSRKLFIIWLSILILLVIGFGIILIIVPNILSMEPWNWMIPVYGFISAIIVFFIMIAMFVYVSGKPAFDYLYPEIYKKINLNESLLIKYESDVKEKQEFNNQGGLYTRFASLRVKRKVSGLTMDGHEFTIYDSTIISSNGKSSNTHFNGIYFQVKTNTDSYFQVRTHGSPKMKGMKFERRDDYPDIRVYTLEGLHVEQELRPYIEFVRKHKGRLDQKTFDISVIPGETHVGIWYKKHPARRQKHLSKEKLNEIYKYFLSEMDFADKIVSIRELY